MSKAHTDLIQPSSSMLDKYTSERQSISGELRALEGQKNFIPKLKKPGSSTPVKIT
jgi:hypothetical protein